MYALAWQAPKAKTNAKYRYCVTLSDRAGTVTGAELWPHPTEVALLSDATCRCEAALRLPFPKCVGCAIACAFCPQSGAITRSRPARART